MKVSNRFKWNYCLAAFQHNINKWAHCWSRFNWNWKHVGQTIYPLMGPQKQKNVIDIWKQCYCPEDCCSPHPSYMSLFWCKEEVEFTTPVQVHPVLRINHNIHSLHKNLHLASARKCQDNDTWAGQKQA